MLSIVGVPRYGTQSLRTLFKTLGFEIFLHGENPFPRPPFPSSNLGTKKSVGVPRFELGTNAPKAFVLPLHHTPWIIFYICEILCRAANIA